MAQFKAFSPNVEVNAQIDVAYHMNHRGGEIGNYEYQKTGERSALMICCNPYPCDFDRGIIESMIRRFKPKDSLMPMVDHNQDICRKKGDELCKYIVTW